MNYIKGLLVVALCSLFVGCNEDVYIATITYDDPIITDFYPESGEVGTEVTIYGENLQITKAVTIGGGDAPIVYRISEKEIVVEISTDTRSGGIELVNNFDKVATYNEKTFSVTYATPVVTDWTFPITANVPVEGTYSAPEGNWGESSQMLVFEGSNLHFVDEVQFVYESTVEGETVESTAVGTFITQRENEIVVEIPLIDVSSDSSIRLSYYDGSADNYVDVAAQMGLFHIIVLVPQITTEIPASLTKYTPVTLEGYNLNLINSLYVINDDDVTVKLRMTTQTSDYIIVDIATDFFSSDYVFDFTESTDPILGFTGTLHMVYNTTKDDILAQSIDLYGNPNEARYYTYTSIFMSGRSTNSGGTDTGFLDLETGTVYTACNIASSEYAGVDIMLYDQTGYCQLYGAHNSNSTYKNYKCDGTSLSDLISDWASTAVGNTVKYRTLDPTDEDHKALIDAYEAGTIVKLSSTYDDESAAYIPDDALVAAVSTPATSSPKIYTELSAYNSGSASVAEYPYLLVHRSTPDDKYGIIKLTSFNLSADGTKGMDVTFNAIWSL